MTKNCNNFGSKLFIFIILNLICVLVFLFYSINFKTFNSYPISLLNKSKNIPCQPILNRTQYSVSFNGQMYPKSVAIYNNMSINFECLNANSEKKIILFWNPFFSNRFYYYEGDDSFKKHGCPVTNCQTTIDKNRSSEADYVVVHMRNGIDQNFPKYRPASQRWIFLLYESPMHASDMKKYNNFFNLTATYRINSDFSSIYQGTGMKWEKNPKFEQNSNFYDKKKHFSSALISNCDPSSKRLSYIKEMKKYIDVDLYGRCGKPCPKTNQKGEKITDCREFAKNNYKFFFSFENSLCKDYVTEKFFLILKSNIIPVVRGRADYDHYVSEFF